MSSDVLLRWARGSISVLNGIHILPLGMNSCVLRTLVERIRDRQGHAFRKVDPTLTFAFSCLLNATELVHFDEAFYIAQGLEVSNGINGTIGDIRPYLNSLSMVATWEEVPELPIKAALVYNTVAHDFLVTLREYGRSDIQAEWNRSP
jgi:hypothetical protein